MSRKGLEARKVWGRMRAGRRECRRQVLKLVPVEAFATMELNGDQ
jgi:predicted membrane chloride channel (bestrophin family)